MNFDEYVRLNNQHERLKWDYRAAVDLLFDTGYLASDAEYARLKQSVAKARYDLEAVRAKIEQPEVRQGAQGASGSD
jgi:hypothetical protein